MAKIVGSFYLKKEDNGNLSGEYTNNVKFTRFSENADLKQKEGDSPFLGKYLSTWHENEMEMLAELNITLLENSDYENLKYKLVWSDLGATPIYEAEAFLAEGMLIGHYISLP